MTFEMFSTLPAEFFVMLFVI